MKRSAIVLFAVTAMVAPQMAAADWRLDAKASHISLLSIKMGAIAEPFTFTKFEGGVKDDGAAVFTVDLATVNTDEDLRDERMRKWLFETQDYPLAKATAKLDMAKFEKLKAGERMAHNFELTLAMHGKTAKYDVDVYVTRIGKNAVSVTTVRPFMIHADHFAMAAGLEKLRVSAHLSAIMAEVPASFALVLRR